MKPSLEQFRKIINAIQEMEKNEDIVTKMLVCKDSTGWIDFGGDLISETVKLLETALDDKYETIQWWFWEFIREEDPRLIYEDIKGNEDEQIEFNLSKVDSLYYYLTGEKRLVPQRIVKVHLQTAPPMVKKSVKDVFDEMVKQFGGTSAD